jgi:hypothetical protein
MEAQAEWEGGEEAVPEAKAEAYAEQQAAKSSAIARTARRAGAAAASCNEGNNTPYKRRSLTGALQWRAQSA